jgi:ATP-dependent DNA helicase RecG
MKGVFMARGQQCDPRKLMELAIKVMQESVAEPRADGKASPLVGAVLWKPDGTVDTAYRGELRDGDHAEFTLLERKNRDQKLDGCKLFATLEPCAPGARNEPKKSCAERIVWARIKEVWVGIGDPDPKVDRKGIKYLQDNGVTVNMFDRDLQDIIHDTNKDFIAQALDRAEESKKTPAVVTLSSLENAFDTATPDDFSADALHLYKSYTAIAGDMAAVHRRLVQQGLLKVHEKHPVPTGFGMLLFGKEPRVAMPQAGLLATIHYPDGSKELRNFEEPMVLIPGEFERWINDKLPNVIDRSNMRRKVTPAVPFEMVREAVVNALIHRDYSIREAKCQLDVTADTIVVKSPGGPVSPITLEQLQSFRVPMLSRNPELHYIFSQMGMAEERGFGVKSLRTGAEKLGLPLPRYSFDNPYIILTIFRNPDAALKTLPPSISSSMNKSEMKGWQWLVTKTKVRSRDYGEALKVDDRTARRHLNHFHELELLRKVGSGPATEYEVL